MASELVKSYTRRKIHTDNVCDMQQDDSNQTNCKMRKMPVALNETKVWYDKWNLQDVFEKAILSTLRTFRTKLHWDFKHANKSIFFVKVLQCANLQ